MDRFIRCLCFEEYEALLEHGKATDKQLRDAWLTILSEYHEIKSENGQMSDHWKISLQIMRLKHHLVLVQMCVDNLAIRYSDSLVTSLNRLGYRLKITSKDPLDYWDKLVNIINKAKTKWVEIEQLSVQLDKLLKELDTTDKHTPAIFEGMLIAFEEMQHTTYDMETISVYKFVTLEKKYNDYVERLQAKAAKHAGH